MHSYVLFVLLAAAAGLFVTWIVGAKLRSALWTLLDRTARLQSSVDGLTQQVRRLEESGQEAQNVASLQSLDFGFPVFLGEWAIDGFMARRLVATALVERPRVVVELGAGASTVIIARTLMRMGVHDSTHIAVDHHAKYLDISRRIAGLNGVEDRVRWLECPLTPSGVDGAQWYDQLPAQLAGLKIDLLVIDGPPGDLQQMSRYSAVPKLFHLLSEGATVILDDAARDQEKEIARRWVESYPELALEFDPRGHGLAVFRRTGGRGE